MIGMRLLPLWVLLSLFAGISSIARGLALEDASFNGTSDPFLTSRSLEKREVFYHCNNPDFSETLSLAISDATDIVRTSAVNLFRLVTLTCSCSFLT